jgi:hypothetical protein
LGDPELICTDELGVDHQLASKRTTVTSALLEFLGLPCWHETCEHEAYAPWKDRTKADRRPDTYQLEVASAA